MSAPLNERITNLLISTPAVVRSYSFYQIYTITDFSGNIENIPHFTADNYMMFSQKLGSYVYFGEVSLIHSAFQRNATTKVRSWCLFHLVM